MRKILFGLFSFFLFLQYTLPASAHEAYVLTQEEFKKGLSVSSPNPLAPLLDTSHFGLTIIITISVVTVYLLSVLWSTTSWSDVLDRLIRKVAILGPLIIRIAISASFFYAAMANSILGPELSLSQIQGGEMIRFILFALSIMIFLGFLTEFAALIGLILFGYLSIWFGSYMFTYANYLGELLVLFLFGSRFLSIDKYLFGNKLWNYKLKNIRDYEMTIVRILYGVALIYAGWTIKFAHQSLSIDVYNQYHLINFFHASASFIAAGAGLSEILIGLFILLGLTVRITVIISLVFITLSILYFREMLWPHFMLYGISFSLLINSADKLSLDRYLIPFVRNILWHKKSKKRK